MVRDPYWLQAIWELRPKSIERAQAALAEQWHDARPVLRLLKVSQHSSSQAETLLRNIPIHGAVSTWFVEVSEPPSCFRVEIGYLGRRGPFYSLARSNLVTTPSIGNNPLNDISFLDVAENSDRIYAMSGGYQQRSSRDELREWLEERLHRRLGSPMKSRFGNGAQAAVQQRQALELSLDAEVIVFGATHPAAHVTIGGEPVELQADGRFAARLEMPDKRQVIPVVASSRDGAEEQTIVLAVERNTKVMERRTREPGE